MAKKTFEFSITSSLRGLSDVIRERFSHSQVLQDTQAELEAKVKMLCLPVDLLAHYATRGNSALQEPLGVALGVLEEVEAFRQALVQHDVARAQDGSSPEASTASAVQLCRRLRELIARLDSLLPYLSLAISAAVLLNQGSPSPVSYSRLMSASWHLRANPHAGATVFSLPEASWHEERGLTAAGPRMSEALRRCRVTVCRCGGAAVPAAVPAAAEPARVSALGSAAAPGSFGYELLVEQDLDDGLYHEPCEQAATLRVQVADIVALEWETAQGLGQGENEYSPALVLHIWQQAGGVLGATGTPPEAPAPVAAAVAAEAASGCEAHTPPASGLRLASPASSRRGGRGPQGPATTAGGQDATPLPAARGGGGAGVGGTMRRCAITLSPQQAADSDAEDSSDDGAMGGGGAAHGKAAEDGDGGVGGDGKALGGHGGQQPSGAAVLQRQWELLGELEFVLRLCTLESREQAPHHAIADERIALHFQAISAPASTHTHSSTAVPRTAPDTAGPDGSGAPRRGSTAAAAAVQRQRGVAGAAARALSDGVEALTQGVRQLSFTPGGSGHSGGTAPPTTVAAEEAVAPSARSGAGSSGARRQTRSGSRAGVRGFGSPVK